MVICAYNPSILGGQSRVAANLGQACTTKGKICISKKKKKKKKKLGTHGACM
jgi:hypothetical protein